MYFNLPTGLTWMRIVAIPFIVGVFFWPGVDTPSRNILAASLFIIFALTDWADGYLARKLNQTSAFGAFLDPVADKFLVCASLLTLLHLNRVHVVVALVIISREIAISALREWMATIGAHKSVTVHRMGKLKTAAQMGAIPLLLWHAPWAWQGVSIQALGTFLIWVATALTLWSMVYYLYQATRVIHAK